MHTLDIRVNGWPLALVCKYGDISHETVWPGGCGELSWSSVDMPSRLQAGGVRVEGYLGAQRVHYGTLDEPADGQTTFTSQGLWRLGDNFAALSLTLTAGNGPDQAVDNAIGRGLIWKRAVSMQNTAVDIDITGGPVTLTGLLDTMAENKGTRWGVDADGYVFDKTDDTSPSYRTLPLEGGLGMAFDEYASVLAARYLDSSDSTYKTAYVTDPNPTSSVVRERVIDLTPRGPITATRAATICTNLFALGLFKPQFTDTLEFTYGEILSRGSVPIALETVQAGRIVRVHGGLDLTRAMSGLLFVDVPIGRTTLTDGTLTITPQQQAARTLEDVLVKIAQRRK